MRFKAPAFALGKAIKPDWADRDPFQIKDFVSKLGKHAANFTVFPFGQDYLDPLTVTLGFQHFDMARAGFAVAEPNAFGEFGKAFRGGLSGHLDFVGFFDSVAWVRQFESKVTIVGQKQESFAFFVETADRIDPLGHMLDQINRPGATTGIMVGADVTFGLVDKPINDFLGPDRFAINGNGLAGCNLGSETFDDNAIQGDASSPDEIVALSARAHSGMGQVFVQTIQFAHGNLSKCRFLRLIAKQHAVWVPIEPDSVKKTIGPVPALAPTDPFQVYPPGP